MAHSVCLPFEAETWLASLPLLSLQCSYYKARAFASRSFPSISSKTFDANLTLVLKGYAPRKAEDTLQLFLRKRACVKDEVEGACA